MNAEPQKSTPDHSRNCFPTDAHVLWELLEFAPVSLWLEDWSRVKQTLDGWRAAGIADPIAHAAADRSRLETLARAIRVIDVNATSVTVYAAPSKAALIADYESHAVRILCDEMREFFLSTMNAFMRRERHVGLEAWDLTFDGRSIRVHISSAIAPDDHEWRRNVLAIQDVSDAWQARAALGESRDLLTRAANLAQLAHWIRDCTTGAVVHCGEEIASITGRSPEEWTRLVGNPGFETCIAPDDRARYRATVPAALTASTPYMLEYRLWRPDGVERWVRERGAPLRRSTAAEVRYICTLQDITEQRQAETARRDAEAQLRGFLENAPFAMFVKGLDRCYRYANPHAITTLGRPLERIIGHHPDEMFSPEAAKIYRGHDDRVVATRAPVVEETRVVGPVGEIWAEHIRFPIFDETGAVHAIGGIAIDVTERKQNEIARQESEARLRAFFQNADISMILKDAAGRCQLVSRGFERLYGITDEQARGRTVRELMPREFADPIETLDRDVVETRMAKLDERILEREGRVTHLVGIRFPIIGPNGVLTGIGQVSTDVTELKRAEKELREQHEFLRLVIDSAAAYIMVFDGANRLITCNKAYEAFSGTNVAALRADDGWTKTVIAEDLPEVRKALAADDPAKFPNADLTRGVRADGDVRLIHWVNAALTNADGSIKYIVCIGTDITEQSRAEMALRQSESRLKAFMENAPFEIAIKDHDGRYVMANRYVARVVGIPVERLIGHRIGDLKTDPAGQNYGSHDRAVFESGEPITRITSADTPTGAAWAQETKFPIRDAQGQMTGIGSVGIDITERIRVEQALRTSEARWQAFKDNAPFLIFYKDPSGRYVDVNRQAEKFWNRSVEDMVGRTTAEIAPTEDKLEFMQQDREVLSTGKAVTREYHFAGDPQGEWVRDLKFPIFDQDGKVVAIGGIGMDVTDVKRADQALQQSEANLRAVLEGIVEGIVIFDEHGAILAISRATERMLGHNESDLVGRQLEVLFPGLVEEAANDAPAPTFLTAIERGMGKSQELEALASNGQRLAVAFSVNELPPSGGVRRFVGTILDLTQHKALEDRLRQAQKMETIGQFTGGIAHDFNNLLAVIIGNLDLLASRASDERARKLVDRASGAALRGADLTRRLLAFARRQRLEPEAVDLGNVVREMIPLVERTVGPEIHMKAVIPAGLWGALVDRVQLEAALLNLIGNARDAMPNGGELVIRAANHTVTGNASIAAPRLAPGRYVEIVVIDGGSGMPPEVVQRAFEPFFTTKGVGRGTGLGLSMVHGFIRQSGGDVRIMSQPGVGTTVCLYLPATDRPTVEAAEPAEPAVGHGRQGQRILVVDDEPEVLALVKDLLVGLGYSVDGAGSGREALERLRQPVAYDLLLTDVRMKGGMSGPQLAAQAKIVHPDLRILFMSGYDDAVGAQGGVPKGADMLLKPFRNHDLQQGVVRALGA
jgi:PAS domain S-box-containing protein